MQEDHINSHLLRPAPWYVVVSMANFATVVCAIPFAGFWAGLQIWTHAQPKQDSTFLQLALIQVLCSLVFWLAAARLFQRAVHVAKRGFDTSFVSGAPRVSRWAAVAMLAGFAALGAFYVARQPSVLMVAMMTYFVLSFGGLVAIVCCASSHFLRTSRTTTS